MTFLTDQPSLATIVLTFSLLCCGLFGSASEAKDHEAADYQLSLSFVPSERQVIGTARITIAAGQRLTLFCRGLVITGTLLRDEMGRENQLLAAGDKLGDELILPPATTSRTLFLSYTKTVNGDGANLIDAIGISLTDNWYPQPAQPMRFQVTATLPEGFSAITEADHFPLNQEGDKVNASFSNPTTAIHFIAGPYTIKKQRVREGLLVYAMFFKEDLDLADGYLQAAAAYLNRYEEEIGPYPYNHYVIVANRLPTGFGIPTFTLLGQAVLRLPFIKDTSLGHEIVHSWFGNGVDVDYAQGNWCEGLTSFLADHAYREEQGEGVADRLETITRYLSYVHKDTAIPLAAFTSASHNQPMAEARRTVGYDRGALLFYELREKIGRPAFQDGLRRFYAENLGKQAGWSDLQKSFAAASGMDLQAFFSQRLTRIDIPDLKVEEIKIDYAGNHTKLSFTLVQQTKQPYSLVVPLRIKTMVATINVSREITEKKSRITIPLDQLPLEFIVDPDHAFLRQLADEEMPAVWSRFLGAEDRLVILDEEANRQRYQPVLDALGTEGLHLTTAAKVTSKELSEHDLLFLGPDQAPSRALFGRPSHPSEGLTVDVRRNPLYRSHVAVLVSSSGADQTRAAGRLGHYGKYSYLEFNHGHNLTKKIQATRSGLRFALEELPTGGATSALSPFDQVTLRLAGARVVYVGESHTSLPDHLLQLRLIEALYKQNPKLAIGMEMFPAASQGALDRYTLGGKEVDERVFLKDSDYYNVWQFDYRLFRDTLRFAKKHHLPVIGLNLDRRIVSEVFRSGGTDSLDPKVRSSLPADRVLDMSGYGERLVLMHDMHMQNSHGAGPESGFIQAQGIWDETMAQNIAAFLTKKPDYRMVVLAGSQHTRKDSGIPPRVTRRLAVAQASVLNISSDDTPANLAEVADYFFLAAPAELPESPKIGIVVAPQAENNQTLQKIEQFSPGSRAEAAGLRKGDILLEVNGYPIAEMADLRIALFGTDVGETIEVKVARTAGGKGGDRRELWFRVELAIPAPTSPHP